MKLVRLFVPVFVLTILLGSCDSFFPSESAINTLTLSPTNRFMKVNDTQQFTATATTIGGTTSDVSNSATWSSSNNSVATVSTTGLVTGKSAPSGLGTATITVSSGGVTQTAAITVTNSTLNSIVITPSSPTITTGSTQQLKATGTLADNSTLDITNLVTWASGDTTKATVSSTGLVTGVATTTSSTVAITATANNGSAITGTVNVTVQ